MSYKTPHHAREFMKAAALAVVHQYVLAFRGKQPPIVTQLLLRKKEIDFNSRLALFFGPEASISAQGVKGVDLHLEAPILEVELKYLRRKSTQNQPVNSWTQVMKDWRWLLDRTNENGNIFRQSAWVVFLPSTKLFTFHSNFQVEGKQLVNGQIVDADYAPFRKLVAPNPAAPTELQYAAEKWERDVLLHKTGTKLLVRREIVGNPAHPVWCLIFSRVGTNEHETLQGLPEYDY